MHNEIILAGLLHDIGKFMQRAYEGINALRLQSRNMENMLCPLWDGRHSHYHVLFTNEFCEGYLSQLPKSLDRSLIANLASYHHNPSNENQKIIQEADHLSSGMERKEDDSPKGQQHFRKVRLRSVMSMIDIGKGINTSLCTHELKSLSSENTFPREEAEGSEKNLTEEYKSLWEEFIEQWENNRVHDSWGYINRTLSILEYFTWCIPSATNVLPDISLYDHCKTTSAIAACLYSSTNTNFPFLIVAGDFNGIQNYIFDIKKGSGGYAKRLRARSFYVSLSSEAVSLKILRSLALPLTQRILFAGGKFFLLLPNKDETHQKISTIREEIDKWLLKNTSGEINFSMVMHEAGKEGILKFSETLTAINHLLRIEKEKPYQSIFQNSRKWNAEIFSGDIIHTDETSGICDSCGKRTGGKSPHSTDEFICDTCDLDFYLGTKLPQAQCILFHENSAGHEILPGISVELCREFPQSLPHSVFLIKNFSGSLDDTVLPEIPFMSGLAVNYIPRDGDDVLTFDAITKKAQGQPRLAYLKGDVDNLGFIFSHGFGNGSGTGTAASISRIATLSRTLEMFFAGHFRFILSNDERFRYIYTVYTGGDDFLCLGPWDVMIDFSEQLHKNFAAFSGHNPNWTMSMGLILAGNHTPVLDATDKADEYLETSKRISGNEAVPVDTTSNDIEPSKNRITLFGTSIPFALFREVLEKARTVSQWLQEDEKTLSSAQIWRLRHYGELYRQWIQTKNTRYLEYIPLFAYELRRNWNWKDHELTPEREKAKEWASSLIVAPDAPDMKVLKFICEFALMANRAGANEERS